MQTQESTIDLRRLWRTARQWRWLLIAGILLCLAFGSWFGFTRLTKYEITGEVLIGENTTDADARAGGMQQMMRTFSVGGFSAAAVNNEILVLGSHDVMLRTVRALDLNRSYTGKTSDGTKARLWKDTPIRIEAPAEQFDTLTTPFTIKIKIKQDGKVDVRATKGFFRTTVATLNDATLPAMLKTPYGSYQILPTDHFANTPYTTLNISVSGNQLAATKLYKTTDVSIPNKLADVIAIDYDCENPKLGIAIVNAIFGEYNTKRRQRLHESSQASIEYYDGRIAETFAKLQQSEEEVKDYQKKNDLMGIDSELSLLVGDAVGSQKEIRTANYNIAYYQTVLDILRNRLGDDILIPQMESLNDPNIAAINEAILSRRDLRRSATEDNEALILLNKRIDELRDLIIENSSKMIAKARADVRHEESLAASAKNRLESYPDYQQELVNLSRDNSRLNALYSYLTQQRESAVLQLYSTANIGFVFQPAYVQGKAGMIKRLIWPIAFTIFGLFCALVWIVTFTLLSRRVKDTMDLAFIGIDRQAVKLSGNNPEPLNRIRNLIMANPERRTLYFAGFHTHDTTIRQIADTFNAVGLNVQILTGFSNNNDILTPDAATQIDQALSSADYIIIPIPDAPHLADLTNPLSTPKSALLLGIRSKSILRSRLKAILKGLTPTNIFTIITN